MLIDILLESLNEVRIKDIDADWAAESHPRQRAGAFN
jgi:hypothetical protein